MAIKAKQSLEPDSLQMLIQGNYLFRGMDIDWLANYVSPEQIIREKLYSSRPVYTAFRPGVSLEFLYAVLAGGPIVIRSTPLDRVIALSYPGSCFGMRNLAFAYGKISQAFPSLVEAYKTTDVLKIPLASVQALYQESEAFRDRYHLLFELRAKFEYHLLNCSTHPPQAVAALLRALIYQERSLGNQPQPDGTFVFDLPIDIIARASQLNHRTVEQVLKGMRQVKLIDTAKSTDPSSDTLRVLDPEGLKEVYGATRDKVSWWPLR
ncbi:MAG: Crp/Fnr family transcriptional regulator [Leptolyngbyaceae cyanobacterium SM1_4_3]|nr:Crp/Fnr family transcriptional regulator [Leptolyngbyaceae cyanobacterium SM1_4_3]NJN89154.1 Crp/Fnr family transcriptional regulator [Leptolyngbyaceae cyanobacterium SL_5_14]